MLKRFMILLLVSALPGIALADTVKGRIAQISEKAQTLQIRVENGFDVVHLGKSTQFVNAKGLKDLGPDDLVEVEFAPGQPAARVTKVVIDLPPGTRMDLATLTGMVAKGSGYVLVDARPGERYDQGHIPTAISITPKELSGKLDQLPKDEPVIFYCGGPTCPFTRQSLEIARSHGFTNVKGFNDGMPGWKKAGKPVHVAASYVQANLDDSHVILDTRPASESARSHIKGAVGLDATKLAAMRKGFIKERKPARLPGAADKQAPIILYGNTAADPDLLKIYGELLKWSYKNVAILASGFAGWQAANAPTEQGAPRATIVYVKKLKPGAISREDFAKIEQSRPAGTVFLDVRQPAETKAGALKGAILIPLDSLPANLAKLPKNDAILAYCANGIRAEMGYQMLKKAGFDKVRYLDEVIEIKPDGSYSFE
jgi:rhodanese-related sulfurtransferase